jgi:hypothetical protein
LIGDDLRRTGDTKIRFHPAEVTAVDADREMTGAFDTLEGLIVKVD